MLSPKVLQLPKLSLPYDEHFDFGRRGALLRHEGREDCQHVPIAAK